jgi:hypothetical protein
VVRLRGTRLWVAALGAVGGVAVAGAAVVTAVDGPRTQVVADSADGLEAGSSSTRQAATTSSSEVRVVSVPSPDSFVPIATADRSAAIAMEERHAADGSVDQMWMDEATGSFHLIDVDVDGRVVYEAASTVRQIGHGSWTSAEVQVDHVQRLYAEVGGALTTEPETGPADTLRRRVDSQELRREGSEVVDGHELVRLAPTQEPVSCEDIPPGGERDACVDPGARCPSAPPDADVVWADPVSLRPVREVHGGGTPVGFTVTYRYYTRAGESLRVLALDVPEGYRRVPSVPPKGPLPPVDRSPDYYC